MMNEERRFSQLTYRLGALSVALLDSNQHFRSRNRTKRICGVVVNLIEPPKVTSYRVCGDCGMAFPVDLD